MSEKNEIYIYRSIKSVSEGEYKEKGSKFLSFAHPVNRIEEAKKLNKFYRKKYYDARHHCFAYLINVHKPESRAADDGEPSNTAGAPILGQIRSYDLFNVFIMVVRYFGGTKLGAAGLTKAYKLAAQDALMNAEIVIYEIKEEVTLKFDYINLNRVMKLVKDFDMKIVNQEFTEDYEMTVRYWIKNSNQVNKRLKDLREITVLQK